MEDEVGGVAFCDVEQLAQAAAEDDVGLDAPPVLGVLVDLRADAFVPEEERRVHVIIHGDVRIRLALVALRLRQREFQARQPLEDLLLAPRAHAGVD